MTPASHLLRATIRVAAAAAVVAVPTILPTTAASAALSWPSWHVVQPMPQGRSDSVGIRLDDGRVLIAGGQVQGSNSASATAELYSPSTDSWSPAADMLLGRERPMGLKLQDGRVLIVGGFCNGNLPECPTGATGTAETFDPATDTWTSAGSALTDGLFEGTLTLLEDGRALLIGGDQCNREYCQSSANAYLFDPTTNTWTQTGSMHEARTYAASFVLADGRVLVAGGVCDQDPCDAPNPGLTAEIFDPAQGTWAYAASPLRAPGYPALIDAGDGSPLLLGAGNVVQKYDAGSDSWSLAAPTPCDYGTFNGGDTHATPFGGTSTFVIGLTNCRTASSTAAMIYRPRFGWLPTTTSYDHIAGYMLVTLTDGRVLLAGGGLGTDDPVARSVEILS